MNDKTTEAQAVTQPVPPVIKHLIGLPLSALHDGTLLLEVLKYEASIKVPLAAAISAEKLAPVIEGLLGRLTDDLEKTHAECGITPRMLALEVCHAILCSTIASFTSDAIPAAQNSVAQLLIGLVAHAINRGQYVGALPEYKEIATKLASENAVNPYVKAEGSPHTGTA